MSELELEVIELGKKFSELWSKLPEDFRVVEELGKYFKAVNVDSPVGHLEVLVNNHKGK